MLKYFHEFRNLFESGTGFFVQIGITGPNKFVKSQKYLSK